MASLTSAVTYHGRWFGNIVVPIVGLVALIHLWRRGLIRGPNRYATVAIAGFVVVFSVVSLYSALIWKPDPGSWVNFSPVHIFVWLSGWPLQALADILLGEDSIVEEHLLIPTAMVCWGIVGWYIGASATLFGSKRR